MKVLKAVSNRESLAKVVRLLTSSNIVVQFRGYKPFVETKGNKVVRLVLPEFGDDAPEHLIEAMHGFLDHEVGHIYFTPFARLQRFIATKDSRFAQMMRPALSNIIEDIRLEKLLPRELPGTKENLERMYEKAIGFYFGPPVLEAVKENIPSKSFCSVIVVGLRALSGQKQFQKFMDDNNLWDHLKPLLVKMPDLSRRLRSMETYEDVEALTDDIIDAIKPEDKEAEPNEEDNNATQKSKDASDKEKKSKDGKSSEDTEDDGDGYDDGGNEDDDCSGDTGDEADESGDGSKRQSDNGDPGEDEDEDGDDNSDKSKKDSDKPGEGKTNKSITDALKMLEPTQRKAIFMYKKQGKSIDSIAEELAISEDKARELVAGARRRLNQIMKGA